MKLTCLAEEELGGKKLVIWKSKQGWLHISDEELTLRKWIFSDENKKKIPYGETETFLSVYENYFASNPKC